MRLSRLAFGRHSRKISTYKKEALEIPGRALTCYPRK